MTEPAAGWYHDPADAASWRWWDGATWTDHVRPVEPAADSTPLAQPAPHAAHEALTGPSPISAPFPVQPEPTAEAQPEPVAEPAAGSGPVQVQPAQIQPEQIQPDPPMTAPISGPVQIQPEQIQPAQIQPDPIEPAQIQPDPIEPAQIQPEPAIIPAPVIEPVPTHAPVFETAAPESAPAPALPPTPEPVAASVIPQPGQVASGPAVVPAPPSTGGSVSMTPAIPVTDQAYWHSAAAEMPEVPRLGHPTTGALAMQRAKMPSHLRDWQDLGSPNTGGVWLLAFSPVILVVVGFLFGVIDGLSGNVLGRASSLVATGVALGLTWVFAYFDQRALVERGYRKPALGWMLLVPPIAYLIARTHAVSRESKRAWPPVVVYVLTNVLVLGIFVVTFTLIAAALGIDLTTLGG